MSDWQILVQVSALKQIIWKNAKHGVYHALLILFEAIYAYSLLLHAVLLQLRGFSVFSAYIRSTSICVAFSQCQTLLLFILPTYLRNFAGRDCWENGRYTKSSDTWLKSLNNLWKALFQTGIHFTHVTISLKVKAASSFVLLYNVTKHSTSPRCFPLSKCCLLCGIETWLHLASSVLIPVFAISLTCF